MGIGGKRDGENIAGYLIGSLQTCYSCLRIHLFFKKNSGLSSCVQKHASLGVIKAGMGLET